MQKVGHHRGRRPKAICKASSGVPLYKVCNGQHITYGLVTALFSAQRGRYWDFGSLMRPDKGPVRSDSLARHALNESLDLLGQLSRLSSTPH